MSHKNEAVPIPETQSVFYAEDGTASVVLEDIYDPNYTPTQDELIDYASWLGMEPDEDEPLMWIAEQGLKSPLPENWRPCKTDNGDVYYFNFRTGESIWDHPLDPKFKALYKREKQKMTEKKPFKTRMDDEVREFLTGESKKGKAKEKKITKKDKDGGLPDTLSQALSKATERKETSSRAPEVENTAAAPAARGKGKFGNLPANPLAKVGKPGLGGGGGLRPIGEEEEKPGVSASALGRQALPGLGGMGGLKSEPKESPLSSTLKTPASLGKPSFEDTGEKDNMESDFKAEIDRMRKEHKQQLEEEKRVHEQETKKLKFVQEQDLQDMEMEFNQQKNATKRRNAARQSEWERDLDEQNNSSKRKYEKELQTEFEQWKKDKDQMHRSQKERQELIHKEDLELLNTKRDDMLRKLKRDHEKEIEEKQTELKDKKATLEKQLADEENRLGAAVKELESKENEIKEQLDALKEKEEANERRREDLEAVGASEDFAVLAERNSKELQDLVAAHTKKVENVRNTTQEEIKEVKAKLQKELDTLKARHSDEEKELHSQWEAKNQGILSEQKQLEEAVKQKRAELTAAADNLEAEKANLGTSNIDEQRRALASLTSELEEELTATRQKHEREKQAIEDTLKGEKKKLEDKKAELERMSNELEQQENEQARKLEEANRTHESAMEALKREFEEDGSHRRTELEAEHNAKIVAEERRLEEEARTVLVDLASQNEEAIMLKRREEEARINTELTELKLAGEQQKREFLELANAEQMKLETNNIDAKINEFKAKEQTRLNDVIKRLEAEVKEKERTEKQRLESQMRTRLQQYQNGEEQKLTVACGASKDRSEALMRVQSEMDEELRLQRKAFDDDLKALTDEYERRNFEMRTEAESTHTAQMEKVVAKQNKQLELLKGDHDREVQDLKHRQEQYLLEQRATSSCSEMFASEKKALEENHLNQLKELRAANTRQLAEEQATHTQRLEEIKMANASELSERRVREHTRQYETVKEKVRTRANDVSDSEQEREQFYREKRRKHKKMPVSSQRQREKENIRQAKHYLKKYKKKLRVRQEHLMTMRAKWEADVSELRRAGKRVDTSVLKQAKKRLDQQAEDLNLEAKQLVDREYWLGKRIKKLNEWDFDTCDSSSDVSSMTPSRPRVWARSSRQTHYGAAEPDVILATLSSLQNQVKHLTQQLNDYKPDPYQHATHHIIGEWNDFLRGTPKHVW